MLNGLKLETVVYFLRVNPHGYDRGQVPLEERSRVVGERISELFTNTNFHAPNVTDGLLFRVEYFYYHSDQVATHVGHLRAQPHVASVAVVGHGSRARAVYSE